MGPKCAALLDTTGLKMGGQPFPSLNNQLSTCSQQLSAMSELLHKSCLKVNQPVSGGLKKVNWDVSVHLSHYH